MTMTRAATAKIVCWRRVLILAFAGTTVTVLLFADDLVEYNHVAAILYVGQDGPAAALLREDIPAYDLAVGRGHDGQQFYAIARSPMHLRETSEFLDRPRYRLQRPLFPLMAWALQPTGGGTGLVIALAAVGVGGVLASGVTAGALSSALGGSAWPALVVPALPGAYAARCGSPSPTPWPSPSYSEPCTQRRRGAVAWQRRVQSLPC